MGKIRKRLCGKIHLVKEGKIMGKIASLGLSDGTEIFYRERERERPSSFFTATTKTLDISIRI